MQAMDSKQENIVTTTRSASLKTSQAPATQTKDLEFGGVPGRQRPLLGGGGGGGGTSHRGSGAKGKAFLGRYVRRPGHKPGGGPGSLLVSGR